MGRLVILLNTASLLASYSVASATGIASIPNNVNIYTGSSYVPVAIIASALIGGIFAIVVVAQHRVINQKQSTVKFLMHLLTDSDYKEHERVFRELANSKNLTSILIAADTNGLKNKQSVMTYLNIYELVCVSIKNHVFDENVIKSIVGDTLVKHYDDAKELIDEIRIREDDNEFYEHMQTIADDWRENPKVIEMSVLKRLWVEVRRL